MRADGIGITQPVGPDRVRAKSAVRSVHEGRAVSVRIEQRVRPAPVGRGRRRRRRTRTGRAYYNSCQTERALHFECRFCRSSLVSDLAHG